jgi:mRNA-degrading endonuclease toxin of MazEF toxin-antitoxin module
VVNRGEIWWYEHPEEKRRPHLILHRAEAIPHLNELLAVPATRTQRRIPTEVALDESDGMPQACVLTLDSLSLVRPVFLTQRITVLGPERMYQVCEALRHAIAC